MHCAHASRCPGCPLIELPYLEQLAWKQAALGRALAQYPLVAGAFVTPTAAAEPIGDYRLRAKLVVQGSALGLFARGTHEVVDIPECRVLRPRVAAVARALRKALPLVPAISSLDLREAEPGVLVTVAVSARATARERRELAETVAGLSTEIASVAVSTRADDAPQLLGQGLEVLVGPDELRHQPDPTAPWHYAAHGAFTQAHGGQIARLHGAIEAELADARGPTAAAAGSPLAGLRVLELYAGSGALGLRLAARGAVTTLVESFEPAVRMAERAAREQGIAMSVVCADAAAALRELVRRRVHFDAVIVDPPRRGLTPEVRQAIAALEPERLLYVSCLPESLARDATHLALFGHRLDRATPFDMIPQSDAVEALARFVRSPAPPPAVLAEDETFLAVGKEPHEALTSGPGGAPSLTERVRRLPNASGATPVAGLEPGVSGVCVFARHAAGGAELERALATSESHFTLLVRGVTHGRGKLGRGSVPTRYERREVTAGHSLLALTTSASDPGAACRTLGKLRHPVLGDERHGDRRANHHFSHRHLLDRPFVHRHALVLPLPGGSLRIEAPLTADLEHALASLRERPAS